MKIDKPFITGFKFGLGFTLALCILWFSISFIVGLILGLVGVL